MTSKTDADDRALRADWYPASSWPMDAGGEPWGDNLLQFAALEHTSAPEAQLVLQWSFP